MPLLELRMVEGAGENREDNSTLPVNMLISGYMD